MSQESTTTFKTIHDCRLELVEYSVMASPVHNITMLQDSSATGAKEYHLASDQDCDFMPCSAARASFGNEDKTGKDPEADKKLMRYLAEHKHMTPYEYQHVTMLVEVPLFIRSQIHRHRTFSFNEISRRYTSDDIEFWVPDKFRGQAKSNKQASTDEEVSNGKYLQEGFRGYCEDSLEMYNGLIEMGVAREIARSVLPQSLITRFYMGGILRNWAHYLALRRDEHAQYEVRVVAEKQAAILRGLWPESCDALGI